MATPATTPTPPPFPGPKLTPTQLQENRGPPTIPFFVAFTVLTLMSTLRILQLVFILGGKYLFKWSSASGFCYTIVITLAKCSVLCLYIRIFRVKGTFIRLCYLTIAVHVAWCVASVLIGALRCIPVKDGWTFDPKNKNTRCVNLQDFLLANSIPNIILDVVIIILPMKMIWNLQLSKPRRIGICVAFCLGLMDVVIACIRTNIIVKADLFDMTWANLSLTLYTTLEGDVGIIGACAPALAPVFRIKCGSWPNFSRKTNGTDRVSKHYGGVHSHRRRFGDLEERSDKGQLWTGDGHLRGTMEEGYSSEISGGPPGTEDGDIPMGRIQVKRNVDVESHEVTDHA
ncbi:MAG: hypothetical protein Q9227_002502 [Pyrenula ochraceoflavens]